MAGLLTVIPVAAFLTWQVVFASQIQITSVKFDDSHLQPTAVSIECAPDKVAGNTCSKQIVTMQILRGEERLASLGHGSVLQHGVDLTANEAEIEGRIDPDVCKSFLRLTLRHLLNSDSATYSCVIYYEDDQGFIFEERKDDTLILNDVDIQPLVKFLFKRLFIQEDNIKDLNRKVKEQENQLKSTAIQIKGKENRIARLEGITKNQSKQLFDLYEKDQYALAFSATTKTVSTYHAGAVLVFDHMLMKQGEGYDATTGLFTASKRGIYVFDLTVVSEKDKEMRFNIKLNGNTLVRVYADYSLDWDQSSGSCVVLMNPGDIVSVVMQYPKSGGKLAQGYPYTLFNGYLLKPLP